MTALKYLTGGIAALALSACSPAVSQHSGSSGSSALTHTQAQTASARTGVIAGRLERVGGPVEPDGKTPVVRLAGTVQFISGKQHRIDVRVGRSGTFRVTLPAGTYRVRGRTPSIKEQLPSGKTIETWCSPTVKVVVRAGVIRRLTVVCPVP